MKARDRYVVGQLYRYEDLTEQEKSDAALTMDNGVAAREMMYRFTMLTSKDIRNRFDYDLDKEWGDRPEIQRLMMDIATNGVEDAAVDREGNRRMIACAILNMDCPWFEVVDTKKGLNEAIADIPKPASPLPWKQVLSQPHGTYALRIAHGFHEDTVLIAEPGVGGWDAVLAIDPDDLAYLLWAANNAQALYEALEKLVSATDLVRMVGFVGPNGEMEPSYKLDASVQSASAALKAARGEK